MLSDKEIFDQINLITGLNDEAVVAADRAALFLGTSSKTLARYRQNGNGPVFIQYPNEDTKARNQKVNYEMGELRKWRSKHRITPSKNAAARRGLEYMSLHNLVRTLHPIWIDQDNRVVEHALNTTVNTFKENFNNPFLVIEWHYYHKVLELPWASAETRIKYARPYCHFLKNLQQDIKCEC